MGSKRRILASGCGWRYGVKRSNRMKRTTSWWQMGCCLRAKKDPHNIHRQFWGTVSGLSAVSSFQLWQPKKVCHCGGAKWKKKVSFFQEQVCLLGEEKVAPSEKILHLSSNEMEQKERVVYRMWCFSSLVFLEERKQFFICDISWT